METGKTLRLSLLIFVSVLLLAGSVGAQESDDLVAEDVEIVATVDGFGQEILLAQGTLVNAGERAYNHIDLSAQVFDRRIRQVGEGSGSLVTTCGAGLLPEFALQPGAEQPFSLRLELFADDAEVQRAFIVAEGRAIDATPLLDFQLSDFIIAVADGAVVEVEWLDNRTLRYGVGCHRDLFTELDWFEYDSERERSRSITHPLAERVTDELRATLDLNDPVAFAHSALRFAPDGDRLIFQDLRNTVFSTQSNGAFQRLLYSDLHNRTLQGINWLENGRLLAYYYGAPGDMVLYFTASVGGLQLSLPAAQSTASFIVPGALPDGTYVAIAATIDDVTGYYFKPAASRRFELMFEAEPPGNNWPAPFIKRRPGRRSVVYIARPIDGEPWLQCFDLETRELHDLTILPLVLRDDERARMWTSPDGGTLALGATGLHSGLWLVDIDGFEACQ